MWNLKYGTNEYNKKEADSQIENKLVVINGEGQYRVEGVEGLKYCV